MRHVLRSAIRSLGRRPGATWAAVVLLAAGIGFYGAAARFVLAQAQQASSVDGRGLVMLQGASPRGFGPMRLKASELEGLDLPGLADRCRLRPDMVRLGLPEGGTRQLQVQQVDEGYFALTRMRPALGRPLMARDCQPDAPPVVVLGHGLWQRVYGGREDLVGTRIPVDGVAREVVGILPRGHAFTPVSGDVSLLLPLDPRSPEGLFLLGRRDPAAPSAPLDAALRIRSEALAPQHPEPAGWHLTLQRPPNFSDTPLWQQGLSLAAPALILCLACAGVGSLLLAQSMARQQEDALRAALGATGRDLVARPLAETLLLACMGGLGGLGVAWALLRGLSTWLPPSAMAEQLEMDGPTLLAALLATGLCALLCALGPTLRAFRLDLMGLIRGDGAGRQRLKGMGLRRGLVALQVGLTTVMLLACAQVLHHGWRMLHRENGLVTRQAVLTRLAVREGTQVQDASLTVAAMQIRASLAGLPGITAVGLGQADPWASNGATGTLHRSDGTACPVWASRILDPGWPAAHGLRVVQGRDVAPGEVQACLVNETLARSLGGKALGEPLRFEDGQVRQVVGVVSDHVRNGRDGAIPEAWSTLGDVKGDLMMTVRGSLASGELAKAVQGRLQDLPPWVEAGPLETIEQLRRQSVEEVFLQAALLGCLATFGLALALSNLYALLTTLVALKAHAFAVRVALGRSPAGVIRDVLTDAFRLAAWGLVPGLLGGLGVMRVLAASVRGLPAFDGSVVATVLVLLGGGTLAAAFAPALAAARRHPLKALKVL